MHIRTFFCSDPLTAVNVDLQDVKIVKQVGGTMDDTELVRGLVLERGVSIYFIVVIAQ